GFGGFASSPAQAQGPKPSEKTPGAPDVVAMIGPVSQDQDLRNLPYVAPSAETDEVRLMRHAPSTKPYSGPTDPMQEIRQAAAPAAMPTPIATYPGISSAQSGCGCLPPDTDGDVGPNHYIQSVNSSIKITDKNGNTLSGPTTYNSFFQPLATSGTTCGTNNQGDGYVFYDHLADRYVVSDFAFINFPGVAFYQCIGVSKTSDPVAGGWWLYAVQVDSANPTFLGDYPKFALWPDAYYFTVNLFSNGSTFNGVRAFALNRAQMLAGTGAPNAQAVAFTIDPTTLGDQYSLVPATFRTGSAPPINRPEYLMSINSPADGSTIENQVFTYRFHVDFATPANSTFGVGANHAPDGIVSVPNFYDAFQGSGTTMIVPQPVTTAKLDTLGDKIMTPLVYQNRGGTESLWASHTINNNLNGSGPTAIRWYQFNTTGNTIPATPVQSGTFNNNADGLWRMMPSIAVDSQGNMAIGYTESSAATEPTIAYAGRLRNDPAGTLGQGEAIMIPGGGHQTSTSGRWGDYSYMSIDPADNATFWHTNEYYSSTSGAGWNTRIGKFKFPGGPLPTFAASRKNHNGTNFDIPLPLTGSAGIECRRGSGVNSNGFQVVVAFPTTVTVGGVNVTSVDNLATATQSAVGAVVTINLANVTDAQTINVTLTNVNDGTVTGDVSIPMGILLGDTNGDRFVNSGDAQQTRNRSGLTADATNFRSDVNTDGTINSGDTTIVRARAGTTLP
ncbi:MAG: dockerin type I domain-containing protein, partial [Verrucomicrobiota bacterium]|nr:dockerin type I domain-containing protein [Verrucomicrobiota bacterium]